MTPIPPEVETWLIQVETDTPRACPDQHRLAAMIRRIFAEEELIVDTERLAKYRRLEKYYPFELFPYQRALIALWLCTYKAPGVPRWKTLFCMLGRGGGKDGFISFIAFCLVSPYNPVSRYDVDICANDEEQATRPVKDLIDVLESPRFERKLIKHFYHTKELVQGRKLKGVVKGRTNNPKHRDGMRSGVVIFNEIHAYQNYDNVKVFRTGLGKKAEPREGFFTSNGDVMDGPLDDQLERCEQILAGDIPDDGYLPFVCRLPSEELVHDEANWPMANPSLPYLPSLLQETRDEYNDWLLRPDQHGDFLTKRMNLRRGFTATALCDYEKIRATNKPLPDLRGWRCIAGLDYAEISDFASVVLHFRRGAERLDIHHSWLCLQSKDLHRLKVPWQDWAEHGLLTLVDDVSINPRLLADYVRQAMTIYRVEMLSMDHFRWTLVSDAFKAIGFDPADKSKVKLVRPGDVMQADPVIQDLLAREQLTWGDDPVMRWAANNVKRVRRGRRDGTDTGNFYFAKIEARSRKTDPFMAFVACVAAESVLGTGEAAQLPPIGALAF